MAGRVVVGVDGSEASLEALSWAHRQAGLSDASLKVVVAWSPARLAHCWPVPSPAEALVDWSPAQDAERIGSTAVATVLGRSPKGVLSSVVEGDAGAVLVNASADADLVVVGSKGHGALAGVLLGSVSAYVARHAACPVVIVRESAPTK